MSTKWCIIALLIRLATVPLEKLASLSYTSEGTMSVM